MTFSDHPCTYVFQVFEGNVDENSYVAHVIDPYMFGTFVRINVVSFNSRPCMRFEISGTPGTLVQKQIIENMPFKVHFYFCGESILFRTNEPCFVEGLQID